MRTACLLGMFFLTVCAGAQDQSQNKDTNFPAGPQYLITSPSPYLLQSIATPSFPASQALGTVSPQTGQAEPVTVPAVSVPADLGSIYWGTQEPASAEPEASLSSSTGGLPAGYFEVGVTGFANENNPQRDGYGLTLAESARYWKEHKPHATRIYTNQDIERLHGG